MQQQVTSFLFIFVFLILNWTFIFRLLPYYAGIQAMINTMAAIFLAQYKIVGKDPAKYWNSFRLIITYSVPIIITLFFYFAIEKTLLENNVKVVINKNRRE